MATYFGYTIGEEYWNTDAYYGVYRNYAVQCPGSGVQNVVSLEWDVKSAGGTPGHIRCAVYDTNDLLLFEGSAEITVSSTIRGWVGHIAFSPANPTLVGGTTYRLAATADSADVVFYYGLGSFGDSFYGLVDYTAAFPANIGGSAGSAILNIRCGVEAAAGGLSIPRHGFVNISAGGIGIN